MNKLLQEYIVERGNEEWASLVLRVPENNSSFRVCNDHHKATKPKSETSTHYLGRMNIYIILEEAEIISSLSTESTYWQDVIYELSVLKTVIKSHQEFLQFVQMRLGLKSVRWTYWKEMEAIILPVKWQ